MLSIQQSNHELVDWKGREQMQTSEARGQLYFIPQMAEGKWGQLVKLESLLGDSAHSL